MQANKASDDRGWRGEMTDDYLFPNFYVTPLRIKYMLDKILEAKTD
jgi:hypothetical protein